MTALIDVARVPDAAGNGSRHILGDALDSWDLSDVADYFAKTGEEMPARVFKEYKRFIHLAMISPIPIVPSRRLDTIWHAHILHTENYISFCQKLGRSYIHHRPSTAPDGDLDQNFDLTLGLYAAVFGETPDAEIWGATSGADCVPPGADCRGTCDHNGPVA